MLLRSVNGNAELEAVLVGYEFPKKEGEKHDSNWLLIAIHVHTPQGQGKSLEPCLLTWEAERLIQWLAHLAEGHTVHNEIGFVEGNLTFTVIERYNDHLTLRVHYYLETNACWFPSDGSGRVPQAQGDMDLELRSQDLLRAARDLRDELACYPQRPW